MRPETTSAASQRGMRTPLQWARDNPAATAYAIGGVTYPVWSLVGDGARDPLFAWFVVSGFFLVLAFVAARAHIYSVADSPLTPWLAGAASLHFFLLASFNDMAPFYAVGSAMSVFVSAVVLRSPRALVLYGSFILALSALLFALEPNVLKLPYWLGPFPTFFLAYQRLRAQRALEHQLEEKVSERTHQLTLANERLQGEIDARARLEDQLRRRQKAEAIGRLAGGVAHDFNNILTTIGVYAELIEDQLPAESPLRDEVERIRRAQRQASDLTQRLLTVGRRSHVPTERVDLGDAMRDLQSLLRGLLGRHALAMHLHDGPLPILANPEQLEQIAINLARNAADAMPEPGRVEIGTRCCGASELAGRIGADVQSGRYASLVFADTGIGMSPETRERAFDPFFSTKAPGRGSGLGLSTLHGVVSQAGGHVLLDSQPGRGARFELFWPLADAPEAKPPKREAAAIEHRRARILLVEDDASVRGALEQVLERAGHDVVSAADGHRALEWIAEPGSHCDLVISDVVMPGMSGLELARSLARSHPDVRVILISGHLNDVAMKEWDQSIPFLAKPFAPSDLTRKVREVLGSGASTV